MENTTDLKKQIEDLIECMYSARFINRMDLIKRDLTEPGDEKKLYFYSLRMYIHDLKWIPLVISGEFATDDEFLLYIFEELRSRNLVRSEFYKIYLDDAHHERD